MVVVDCEVAFYGDPAFDIAFLLTHLFLKGLLHAPNQVGMQLLCQGFLSAYRKQRSERVNLEEIDARVARLLVMLLLARVDGKSPVEYLGQRRQTFVREFTLSLLTEESFNLTALIELWFSAILKIK
jgi:hypothetical protein